jgi:uncharacterized protein
MTHRIETIALDTPSPGTTRQLMVHRFGRGEGPKAYIQAAIHAGETPALLVAHHLLALLENADVPGEVVLVPFANPVGLGQRVHGRHLGRYDLDSGVNFNRDLPDLSEAVDAAVGEGLGSDAPINVAIVREAMAEALAGLRMAREGSVLKAALLGLACDADIVLDLHCAQRALLHLFVDAGLWTQAAELHADLGCAVTLLESDTGSGTAFDHACTVVWRTLQARHPDKAIPDACLAATVELRGFSDVDEDVAATDAENILRFLRRKGVVAGDAGPLPEAVGEAYPLETVGFADAPATGIVTFRVALGDHVRRGDVVAEIVDPAAPSAAAARTPVTSPTDGLVYELADSRFLWAGQTVCHVAGREPLADQRANLLGD